MPDMSDPKLIDFKFKGIKSGDDNYDLLGFVKAETLVGALELARPILAQFRQTYSRINVEFTVEGRLQGSKPETE